jgi:hypothetical protein
MPPPTWEGHICIVYIYRYSLPPVKQILHLCILAPENVGGFFYIRQKHGYLRTRQDTQNLKYLEGSSGSCCGIWRWPSDIEYLETPSADHTVCNTGRGFRDLRRILARQTPAMHAVSPDKMKHGNIWGTVHIMLLINYIFQNWQATVCESVFTNITCHIYI